MDPPASTRTATNDKRRRENEDEENGGESLKRLRLLQAQIALGQRQKEPQQQQQQQQEDSDGDGDDEDDESQSQSDEEGSDEDEDEDEEMSGEEEEGEGEEVDNNNQGINQQRPTAPSVAASVSGTFAQQLTLGQSPAVALPQQQEEAEDRRRSNSFEVNLGASKQPPRPFGDGPPIIVQQMRMMAQAAAQAAAAHGGGGGAVDPSSLQIEPTSNDVLLHPRHGMDFPQFAGNMKLNFLIQQERHKYLSSDHATRAMMIQGVVAIIHQLDPPGRFLKYKGDGNWIEVSNEYAYMQVLQMFIRQPQQQQQG